MPRGHRGVIVTADLVGFQAAVVTDEVCRQIAARTGLERQQLLFNASHSHTGPLVSLDPHRQANSVAHPPLSAADAEATVAYTQHLREQLVQLVCDAVAASAAGSTWPWGMGQVGFPMNRRLPQDGRVVMADNPAGCDGSQRAGAACGDGGRSTVGHPLWLRLPQHDVHRS